MFFRPSSVLLVLALVVLGTPVKRDAATIESDIKGLATESTTLDENIKAFPDNGATLQDAWGIHQAAVQLSDNIVTATNDVSASPALTDEQSTTIVRSAQTFAPTVVATCNDIVSKKAAFQGVNAGEIVENDLKTIKNNADDFGAALLAKIAASQRGNLQAEIDELDAALASAINAYSLT